MFKHRASDVASFKTYIDWFLLSFMAGAVNVGGYLACHRFVTHVTGFATLAGIDFAEANWSDAIGILTVPVYFLFGVMVSAYFVDRRIHEGRKPRYSLVMGLVASCLMAATVGGYLGWFSEFGHVVILKYDYFFLALLCGASGLQNAALTSASGATIRTTHLTGITTDLGIGMIRAASLPDRHPRRAVEIKSNYLRLGTVASFMFGSLAGALLFARFQYLGFALPTAIAIYAMVIAAMDDRNVKMKGDEPSPRSVHGPSAS